MLVLYFDQRRNQARIQGGGGGAYQRRPPYLFFGQWCKEDPFLFFFLLVVRGFIGVPLWIPPWIAPPLTSVEEDLFVLFCFSFLFLFFCFEHGRRGHFLFLFLLVREFRTGLHVSDFSPRSRPPAVPCFIKHGSATGNRCMLLGRGRGSGKYLQ